MKAVTSLAPGYREFEHINLQTDKKTALAVNIAASVLFVALIVLGHFAFVPIRELFSDDSDVWMNILRFGVMIGGYFAYIVLHELTHAAAMKLFRATEIRFGFTGLYAYAGSEADYFSKGAYRVIALAPLIVWTILLTAALLLVPGSWFWVFYFIQCGNIAGCAGDIYVTAKLWRMPFDILVRDTGVEMFIYSRRGKAGYRQGTKKL